LATERSLDPTRTSDGAPGRTALAGLRFPDGEYTITVAANEQLCRLVDAPPLPAGVAHPVFGHLATHVGKGVTFAEFADIVGAPVDAGYLFGGGSLDFWEPLRLETRYLVRGGITTVVPQVGRKTGPFDVITTELDLVDATTDRPVSRSRESYIVPRRNT
jgi:hypothetical protein